MCRSAQNHSRVPSPVLSLTGRATQPCLGSATVRQLRVEAPSTIPARLGSFALVLVLAAAGGWCAGQSVGPIRLPGPEAATHAHLEGP
jgi:hypothetical protein